ncbi:MAG: hypothetical protein WC804_12955 [Sphingomonas sp.]
MAQRVARAVVDQPLALPCLGDGVLRVGMGMEIDNVPRGAVRERAVDDRADMVVFVTMAHGVEILRHRLGHRGERVARVLARQLAEIVEQRRIGLMPVIPCLFGGEVGAQQSGVRRLGGARSRQACGEFRPGLAQSGQPRAQRFQPAAAVIRRAQFCIAQVGKADLVLFHRDNRHRSLLCSPARVAGEQGTRHCNPQLNHAVR